MNTYLSVAIGLVTGVVLGIVFFRGLWTTVGRFSTTRNPLPWLIGSFLLRVVVCVAGFYFVVKFAGPAGLLACVAGFLGAQVSIVRILGRKVPSK